MVHRRQLGDETLVFGVHGALWGNAMTWWDHDTGSVWSQPIGEAIAGPRKGETIDLLASSFTTWSTWLSDNPDTLALDAPGGNSGFDLGELHIVVDFSEEVRSYAVNDLRRFGVANDVVAGVDVAVVVNPANNQNWNVFARQVGDHIVELEVDGDVLVDTVTGTTFDPARGIPISGPITEIMDILPGFTSFPSDVETFWPDAEQWQP